MECRKAESTTRLRTVISVPPSWNDLAKNSVDPAQSPPLRCQTFPAPVCTNGVWPPLRLVSVAQKIKPLTIVAFQSPIHRPPMEHGLTVLDDETIDWQLNTCP